MAGLLAFPACPSTAAQHTAARQPFSNALFEPPSSNRPHHRTSNICASGDINGDGKVDELDAPPEASIAGEASIPDQELKHFRAQLDKWNKGEGARLGEKLVDMSKKIRVDPALAAEPSPSATATVDVEAALNKAQLAIDEASRGVVE